MGSRFGEVGENENPLETTGGWVGAGQNDANPLALGGTAGSGRTGSMFPFTY